MTRPKKTADLGLENGRQWIITHPRFKELDISQEAVRSMSREALLELMAILPVTTNMQALIDDIGDVKAVWQETRGRLIASTPAKK